MGWFGPPNIEKMKAKRDVYGLFKLMLAKHGELSNEARQALIQTGAEVVQPLAEEVLLSKGPSYPIAEFVDIVTSIGAPAVPSLAAVACEANFRTMYLATLGLGAVGTEDAIIALRSIAEATQGSSIILTSLAAAFANDPIGARVRLPLLSGLHGMYTHIGCAGDASWKQLKTEHTFMVIRTQPITTWEWMAGAFAILGDQSATSVLQWHLNSEDPYIRRVISLSLGLMGDPAAIEPLTEKLQDSDPGVRQAASLALKAFSR